MSSVPPNTDTVSFENAIEREKARQQRHTQGGQRLELSDNLPVTTDPIVPQGTRKRTRPVKPPVSHSKRKKPTPAPPPPPPPKTPDSSEQQSTVDDVWSVESQKASDTLEQLLTQLPDYDNVDLPATPVCPFHRVSLEYCVSKNGWPYVKCSTQPCIFFTSQQELVPYLDAIGKQWHPDLIFQDGDMGQFPNRTCWCNETLGLRTSKSEKNPGRLFLTCQKRLCDFFQWVNLPWSKRILDEKENRASEMHAYRTQPIPPHAPTWYNGRPFQPKTKEDMQAYRNGLVLTG